METVAKIRYEVNNIENEINGFIVQRKMATFTLYIEEKTRKKLREQFHKHNRYLSYQDETITTGWNNYKSKTLRKIFMDGKKCHVEEEHIWFPADETTTKIFLTAKTIPSTTWGIWRRTLKQINKMNKNPDTEPGDVQEQCIEVLEAELTPGNKFLKQIHFLEEDDSTNRVRDTSR